MDNAILIESGDTVVVAVEPVAAGDAVVFALKDGTRETVTAREDIPVYHKIARRDLPAGSRVTKYGELIGEAYADIAAGAHVHTHNVRSPQPEDVA